MIARIELNGKPVTELWKTPFACDITPYLQAGQNTLKVSVANEWPNRLIGDDALPQEKRVTFTTYNPYKKGTPLLRQACWVRCGGLGGIALHPSPRRK